MGPVYHLSHTLPSVAYVPSVLFVPFVSPTTDNRPFFFRIRERDGRIMVVAAYASILTLGRAVIKSPPDRTLSLSDRRALDIAFACTARKVQMKTTKLTTAVFAALTLLCSSFMPALAEARTSQDQTQATALMRGYRTGYSDGYQAGVSDLAGNANREFQSKPEYDHADRAFNQAWGSLDEYRDGYRQGYEVGYNAAYDHKPFDSSIPPDLKRRTEDSTVQYPKDVNKTSGDPNQAATDPNKTSATDPNKTSDDQNNPPANNSANGPLVLPRNSILRVELMNNLSSDASQQGERFSVRVLEPNQYQGAVLDGHIAQVKRPGKAKGNAELQLAFDTIKLPSGQSSKITAQVIEVIPNGGSQGVGKVDPEGGVNGRSSTKSDVQKVAAATGIGAVIGVITGGGTGAAIGGTIGAGVGTAGVLTERGKDIHLTQGQQLRIRTNTDAEIQ
jgi:hypothetical protein